LSQIQLGQADACGMERRRRGEQSLPVLFGSGEPAFLTIQNGQMVAHEWAAQAGIDAGEDAIAGDRDGPGAVIEQPRPADAGGDAVAALLAQLAFDKQQLGIIRTADGAGMTNSLRLLMLSQAAMAQRQQSIQLGRDGIGVVRMLEALVQEGDGVGMTAEVGEGPAEIEQREGIVGPLGQIQMQ
jgi:hypothetical protein